MLTIYFYRIVLSILFLLWGVLLGPNILKQSSSHKKLIFSGSSDFVLMDAFIPTDLLNNELNDMSLIFKALEALTA